MVQFRRLFVCQRGDGSVDVHDLADHAGLEHRHEMSERRTVGRLVGDQQGFVSGFGYRVQFLGLSQAKDKRSLAQDILSGFKGRFYIFIMSVVR